MARFLFEEKKRERLRLLPAKARGVPNNQPNSGYHVTEKVWTPYIMAPLDGHLGAATLTGNIGFQGVHTDLTSASPAYLPGATNTGCGCPASI